MRKLKLQMQLSADGFVAGPNGEMDWMVWNWDEALKNYVTALTEPVDTIVLGRRLAQGFIPNWKSMADNPEMAGFARKMVDTPKVVFSKSLQEHDWAHTTLAKGNLTNEINSLKGQPGGDIIAYGGAELVSALVCRGLVDEYHLFINPAVLGEGLSIFNRLETKLNFKQVSSTSFECGITVLHYQPVYSPEKS